MAHGGEKKEPRRENGEKGWGSQHLPSSIIIDGYDRQRGGPPPY